MMSSNLVLFSLDLGAARSLLGGCQRLTCCTARPAVTVVFIGVRFLARALAGAGTCWTERRAREVSVGVLRHLTSSAGRRAAEDGKVQNCASLIPHTVTLQPPSLSVPNFGTIRASVPPPSPSFLQHTCFPKATQRSCPTAEPPTQLLLHALAQHHHHTARRSR